MVPVAPIIIIIIIIIIPFRNCPNYCISFPTVVSKKEPETQISDVGTTLAPSPKYGNLSNQSNTSGNESSGF